VNTPAPFDPPIPGIVLSGYSGAWIVVLVNQLVARVRCSSSHYSPHLHTVANIEKDQICRYCGKNTRMQAKTPFCNLIALFFDLPSTLRNSLIQGRFHIFYTDSITNPVSGDILASCDSFVINAGIKHNLVGNEGHRK